MSKVSFLIFILFLNCEFVKTGVNEHSANIKLSKKNKVFICEYKPLIKNFIFENNNFTFGESWVEYKWTYLNQNKDIEIYKDLGNMYIKIDNPTKYFELVYKLPRNDIFYDYIYVSNKHLGFGQCGNNICLDFNLKNKLDDTINIYFKTGKKDSLLISFIKK